MAMREVVDAHDQFVPILLDRHAADAGVFAGEHGKWIGRRTLDQTATRIPVAKDREQQRRQHLGTSLAEHWGQEST